MHLTIHLRTLPELLPDERSLAEAAGRGISNLVKRHLVQRNVATPPPDGLPKSNYYADAATSVTTQVSGRTAVVSIPKEGMAIHYYGGVIYPSAGKKALAVPKHAAAAGKRPAELDPARALLSLVWPKGETAGTLRDRKSGDVFYLLIPKARIRADKSVLPTDEAMADAARAGMEAIAS